MTSISAYSCKQQNFFLSKTIQYPIVNINTFFIDSFYTDGFYIDSITVVMNSAKMNLGLCIFLYCIYFLLFGYTEELLDHKGADFHKDCIDLHLLCDKTFVGKM